MMNRLRSLVLVAVAVAVACLPARTACGSLEDEDRWYVLEMDGQRAGWLRETRSTRDGLITTTNAMRMDIRRGQVALTITVDTSFVETPDGTPVRMSASTDLGGMGATSAEYTFTPDGVDVVQRAGGAERSSRAALPAVEWLPPAAASRLAASRIAAALARGPGGEDEPEAFSVTTIDPSNGLTPVTSTRRGLERTTVEVFGRTTAALRTVTTVSLLPGVESVEFIDERGDTIRTEMSMGVFTLTVLLADEALATSPLDPPELMRSTFITPDKAIADARGSRRGVYLASVAEGEMPDLEHAGVQRFERLGPDRGRVVVDLAAEPTGLAAAEPREGYLDATAMLQSDDARVADLAARLASDETDPARVAERLREGVFRYMSKKGLGVGFASALECVLTREGDCTEHGVLLAALLRARGIPSRVVSGVIYADSFAGAERIFGYHMWSQALIPGVDGVERWVDLDATLPAGTPFDATHIALDTDALDGDSPINALVNLAPMIGRLRLSVESVE